MNTQDNTKEYVVLRGLKHDNVFFTANTPGSDPTKSAEGEIWYEILGYADTIEEAQALIAGYNIAKYGDADFPLKLYLAKMAGQMANIDFDKL
jgi:hypothetical protein